MLIRLLSIFTTACFTLSAQAAAPKGDDLVKATLFIENSALVAGTKNTVAVVLAPEAPWHIYWKNSGDTGIPSTFKWTLPEGFAASDAKWPIPNLHVAEPLLDYVYETPAWHLFDVDVPASASGSAKVAVEAKWLVCDRVCLPGSAKLELTVPVAKEAKKGPHAKDFERAVAALPLESPRWKASAQRSGNAVVLTVLDTEGDRPYDTLHFLPWNKGEFANFPPQPSEATGNVRRIRVTVDEARDANPKRMTGVLVAQGGFAATSRQGLWIDVDVADAVGSTAATAAAAPLWQMLLFAFLGGMILNLMPCVFPVLSIKILGFVDQADQTKGSARAHGWAFFAGVVMSFWALAGTLLALRAAGQTLGWGFQLQSPLFVVALALLFFVLGLYFLGVFEVGGRLMQVGQGLASKAGYAGSFFSGALATVAATPCTAPFMGSAVGFALLAPPIVSFLLFTTLGVGMAFPYVVLSASPALLRKLPRPGRWMESLKEALAFPLFGTTLWLAWVLGQQKGLDATTMLLFSALCLATAAWLFGRWDHTAKPKPRAIARVFGALLLVLATYVAVRAARTEGTATAAAAQDWVNAQPWSKDRIASLQAEGRPVFVDFTAAWCLSCQLNERVVFGSSDVREKFLAAKVAVLKADWTNGDEAITRGLAEFGRSGVPFYLFYPGRAGAEPVVLPELSTPGLVTDALEKL